MPQCLHRAGLPDSQRIEDPTIGGLPWPWPTDCFQEGRRSVAHHSFTTMIVSASTELEFKALVTARNALRTAGQKLVMTNGCFDLLHVGHTRYLQAARNLGDALLVALNSDESVRELKGPDRPLVPEAERAEVLAALSCVDHIAIFPEKRVTNLIRVLSPDVYAKGGDYTVETLDAEEREALEAVGAEIMILPLIPGRSTSSLLEKMQGKSS